MNEREFQLEQVKTERARRSFKAFVMQAWPVLEPSTEFVEGIHIDAICSHLQAVTEGRIAHLIINVPPGHAKSLLTAVFWPAWVWINHPQSRWLFSSYREPLATRDSVKCRRLIESDWYQHRWGGQFQLRADQNQKQRFENDCTGYRIVVPMSAGTGERGDYVVVDDPHSVDQAASDTERTAAVEWWNGSMSTRLNHPSQGHKIVIQQRLHEADLTGDLLSRVRTGDSLLHVHRMDRSTECRGRIVMAPQNQPTCPRYIQDDIGELSLRRAVSTAACASRWWNAEAALVALLAATWSEPAPDSGKIAGWHDRTAEGD